MTATTFTAGIQASLGPWADANGDWQKLNAALGALFEDVYSIVVAQGSPDDPANYTAAWSPLLDPNSCPDAYLPYCAQFVGVTIPSGTDPATARALILAEKNFSAGSPATIIATAQRFLTGTQSVYLVERQSTTGSDAYAFQLIVRSDEISLGKNWDELTTPWSMASGTWVGSDQTVALTNAVNAVKPAGVVWSLVTSDGYTWAEATLTWASEARTWQESNIAP